MKLHATMLAIAAAVSVIFWYAISSLLLMLMPGGFLRFLLTKMPMNVFSLVLANAVIVFVSAFLVVWTAAFLYNRWVD